MPQDFRNAPVSQRTQRPLPPVGLTTGRIYYLVDLGTQEVSFTDPKTKKEKISFKPKIKMGIELPFHEMPKEDGEPERCFSVFPREMTWSMNEKSNFPPFCQSIFGHRFSVEEELFNGRKVRIGILDGKELAFKDLLGVYLKVSIVHSKPDDEGIVYANVGSFSEFPEPQPDDPPRYQKPNPRNPNVFFDLGNFSQESFALVYPWDQEKIVASKEWEKMHEAPVPEPQNPDYIPF